MAQPLRNEEDVASRTADRSRRKPPFGAPHVFVLAVVDGDDAKASYRIVSSETVIGRDQECDIPIPDEQISKVHCRIRVEGPVATIVDAGSRNGTCVNGRRLVPNVAQRLKSLDEIEVGSHRLLLITGRSRAKPKPVIE
jgi:pSer/pThr/pTyr-binding forkhead associated (FHA) protein